MTLKCAIVQPGVYNLNRLRVAIIDPTGENDGSSNTRSHFVNEIKLEDDILISVHDSAPGPGSNLISLE